MKALRFYVVCALRVRVGCVWVEISDLVSPEIGWKSSCVSTCLVQTTPSPNPKHGSSGQVRPKPQTIMTHLAAVVYPEDQDSCHSNPTTLRKSHETLKP